MLHFSVGVGRQRSWRRIFTGLENKFCLWFLNVAKTGVVRRFQVENPAVGVEATLKVAARQADAHYSIAVVRIDIQSCPFLQLLAAWLWRCRLDGGRRGGGAERRGEVDVSDPSS